MPTSATVQQAVGSAVPAVSLEGALRNLFDQADVIFTGEVIEVRHAAAAVEVQWQVEGAVRGVTAGQQYTLREWAGLWQANNARYVKGQRSLLMLHAPSAAGYASPVGGADGVIALRGDADTGDLDLGLLQQRVLVTDAARLRPALALEAAGGSLAVSDALQLAESRRYPTKRVVAASRSAVLIRPMQSKVDDAGTPVVVAAQATPAAARSIMDADVVVRLLQTWQRQRGVVR